MPTKEENCYYPGSHLHHLHPVALARLCVTRNYSPPRIFFKLWLHSVDIPSGKLRISSAFSNRNSSVSSHECASPNLLSNPPLSPHTHYHPSTLHLPLPTVPNQTKSTLLCPLPCCRGPKSIPQWGWLWAVVRGWSGLASTTLTHALECRAAKKPGRNTWTALKAARPPVSTPFATDVCVTRAKQKFAGRQRTSLPLNARDFFF